MQTSTAAGELHPGTRIGGRYLIEGRLGRGGFAAVYRARQDNLGRPVALKVLRPHPRIDLGEQHERLRREAVALSRLSAPGCVRIYDWGELPDGRPWIAQEYIAGQRLDVALQAGAFDEERAVEVACQVLDALADAHAHGVVHRDIKPDNIMLVAGADGRERVKVLDFGIARLQAPHDTESFRTTTRHVFGTPQYMAPEAARQEVLGPTTDLYAVGILLYRMLTGREPFDGPNGYEVLRAQVHDAVPPLTAVSWPLAAVVHQSLAKGPLDRYPSALEMRQALRAAFASRGLPAPPVRRRRRALWVAAIAAGVAAGFLLGQLTARWERAAIVRAAPTPLEHVPALGAALSLSAP